MPMVRCPQCDVHQYVATPHVTPAECVVCDRPLLAPRPPWSGPTAETAHAGDPFAVRQVVWRAARYGVPVAGRALRVGRAGSPPAGARAVATSPGPAVSATPVGTIAPA
jgi:hypothetical protein